MSKFLPISRFFFLCACLIAYVFSISTEEPNLSCYMTMPGDLHIQTQSDQSVLVQRVHYLHQLVTISLSKSGRLIPGSASGQCKFRFFIFFRGSFIFSIFF